MQFRRNNQKKRPLKDSGGGWNLPNWINWLVPIIIIAVTLYLWFQGPFGILTQKNTEINYSAFREQLREGNITQVTLSGDTIQGQFKQEITIPTEGQKEPPGITHFVTYIPSFGDDRLLELLEEQQVVIKTESQDGIPWISILINFAPFLLLLIFFIPMLNRMRSQGQGFLTMMKSRARLYSKTKESITFEDVAGLQSAKTELKEIIEFLKEPKRFQRLGGEIPRGVILVGPPGTGKTLLARAVAGEADVPFFSITGSNFMEMFVGVGASRVRDLFETAKQVAPSIVFIDELDSIGRRRGAGLGGGHDEREQTLNQLLSELDGFEPNESVIVMAATNRPDILDPALLRPGRFDRRITVDSPALKDRKKILQIHARNKPLDEDVDLEKIARGTPGFSGADLENLLNEAALLAARKGKDRIQTEDVEEARDKVLMGLEREGLSLSEMEIEILSYHEGGHALLAVLLPNADPIHKVSIVPRGRSMGVTQQLPEGDKYIFSKEYLLDRLAVMMGGRAAEELIFRSTSSGAQDDLKQATQLARKMVLDWAMSDKLGPVALGSRQDHVFLGEEIGKPKEYSEETAREVDMEIKHILDQAYERALSTLKSHRDELDRIANGLKEKEEMTGEELLRLIGEKESMPS
jgi:cell division protease FtsH